MRFGNSLFLAVFLVFSVSAAQDRSDDKPQRRELERKRVGADGRSARVVSPPQNPGNSPQSTEPVELITPEGAGSTDGRESLRQFFSRLQEGLLSGDVNLIARHLGSHVMLNLRDGENGSFSTSQAYYVLQNYLQNRRVLHMELSLNDDLDVNPYATGSAGMNIRGTQETVKIYISVTKAGNRWVITQITFS